MREKVMLTVLMSMYNSGRYLREAIDSTLSQTHRDFEFLIVDDGSSDNSLEIANEYQRSDPRIRIIAHENWGAAAALNHAANQAAHEWLFRMDPDDVMLPNRLERQLVFLKENPDLAVASSLVELIDSAGKRVGFSRSPYVSRRVVNATTAGPKLVGFHHPAAAIRKSVFQEVGGYRKQYWPADDLDLWGRIGERGHGMLVQSEYLLKYRLHSASISMSAGKHQVLTIDWVEDSKNRRRAGLSEQTFEEFLADRSNLGFVARCNGHRRTLARTLYKAATHHWAVHEYIHFTPKLLGALALEPGLVIPRLAPRLAGWMTGSSYQADQR
jgi:glycosyltransferase involved in cell wall biosynthesis